MRPFYKQAEDSLSHSVAPAALRQSREGRSMRIRACAPFSFAAATSCHFSGTTLGTFTLRLAAMYAQPLSAANFAALDEILIVLRHSLQCF